MDQRLLLTTTYLGPIDYFRQIYTAPKVVIEQNDHYTKQTYRNRCRIATSNHLLDLTIPVIRPKEKCPTKEIQISYKENWRINHSVQPSGNTMTFSVPIFIMGSIASVIPLQRRTPRPTVP